jgi:Uncharacterized protein conserved in bacteria (DUF2066)
MRTTFLGAIRLALTGVAVAMAAAAAHAAGPIEISPFAVQGVEVDVTDTDSAAAKDKALIEVQMKAFVALAGKQESSRLAEDVAKFEAKDVMPFLKSLSIEEESTSPGRYQGRFTVRFLPQKIKPLYEKYGLKLDINQGPPILIIPVWTENGKTLLWEDNAWRSAWLNLGAAQTAVPLLAALGDAEDQKLLTAADIEANDALKLEAIRRRYDVQSVLIAAASPAEAGGVAVQIAGESPIGRVRIDKTYADETAAIPASAELAVRRFHDIMVEKYRKDLAKIAAAKAEQDAARQGPKSVPVAVPFASPSQWNGIRARILAAPGIAGVDVSSLGPDGAVIQLRYRGALERLTGSFAAAGLQFAQVGGTWVIQPN